MDDPRVALGYEVEVDVRGPYAWVKSNGAGEGGTLDVGLVAHNEAGERIVIGEIWAVCPTDGEKEKTRIDAAAVASGIIEELNK